MGWVYLDDGFPEHPKVQQAGDLAAWLYVSALCYSNRNNTVGHIPRSIVGRLTGLAKPGALAEQLVAARLWEPGDDFEIHNYMPRNESALSRSEKARQAAKTRWDRTRGNAQASIEHVPRHPPSIALSNAQASSEQSAEQCVSNADAMPSPNSQFPSTPSSSSVVTETQVRPSPKIDDDDDDDGSCIKTADQDTDEATVAKAFRVIAKRRMAGKTIDNPGAYLRVSIDNLAGEFPQAKRLVVPGITPEQLADMLGKAAGTQRPATKPADPVSEMQAAQRSRARRSDLPPCPICGTRGGGGWVETDDGNAEACPDCGTKATVL